MAGQGKSHRARISCEYLPQEASTQPELGNHSKHLPSIYFQAGNVLSTLHALTHLISATHPTCRHYYYPHFTDEETGPERGNNPYKVTVSGGCSWGASSLPCAAALSVTRVAAASRERKSRAPSQTLGVTLEPVPESLCIGLYPHPMGSLHLGHGDWSHGGLKMSGAGLSSIHAAGRRPKG